MKIPRSIMTIPNALSSLRIGLLLPMWALAIGGWPRALGMLILICLLTDFLDGYIARRRKQTTSFGAKLDSAADNALLISAPFWVYMLRPELVHAHPLLCLGFVVLVFAVFVVMIAKFRRNVEIHTYASKLGVVVMWSFIVYVLLIGYSEPFFIATIATSYFYLIEDLILLIGRSSLDEHERGILF